MFGAFISGGRMQRPPDLYPPQPVMCQAEDRRRDDNEENLHDAVAEVRARMAALKAETSIKTTVEKTTEIKLAGHQIIGLLRNAGVTVPDGARVAFRVPGGGDYSNTTLDIDAGDPVVVTYTERTEECS